MGGCWVAMGEAGGERRGSGEDWVALRAGMGGRWGDASWLCGWDGWLVWALNGNSGVSVRTPRGLRGDSAGTPRGFHGDSVWFSWGLRGDSVGLRGTPWGLRDDPRGTPQNAHFWKAMHFYSVAHLSRGTPRRQGARARSPLSGRAASF